MRYDEYRLNHDHVYLLPISDCHIGDKNFDETRLRDNINWVENTPNAFVFLGGDLFNVATRNSKTAPSEESYPLRDQIDEAINIFEPIKERILGAIDGNHERRLLDYCGYSPLQSFCGLLNIKYYNYSVVLRLLVGNGKRIYGNANGCVSYVLYMHHTTGGGGTIGGKMNRIDKLRRLVCNADAYIGGHNHQLGVIPVETRFVDEPHRKITRIRQLLIDSGSYLKWDEGYGEAAQLEPSKLGSPRIRLDGRHKDIHASV
ncbi:MAG: metallophosphoesterase [Proteobacteria bacterium]|nr:metallophosphoesterase [Pseudomonadota bacterium]